MKKNISFIKDIWVVILLVLSLVCLNMAKQELVEYRLEVERLNIKITEQEIKINDITKERDDYYDTLEKIEMEQDTSEIE